MLPKDITD